MSLVDKIRSFSQWESDAIAIIEEVMTDSELYQVCNGIDNDHLKPLKERVDEIRAEQLSLTREKGGIKWQHSAEEIAQKKREPLTKLAKRKEGKFSKSFACLPLSPPKLESSESKSPKREHQEETRVITLSKSFERLPLGSLNLKGSESERPERERSGKEQQNDVTGKKEIFKQSSIECLPLNAESFKLLSELNDLQPFLSCPISDFALICVSSHPEEGEGNERSELGKWVEKHLVRMLEGDLGPTYAFSQFYQALELCFHTLSVVFKITSIFSQPTTLDPEIPAKSDPNDKALRLNVMLFASKTALLDLKVFIDEFFKGFIRKAAQKTKKDLDHVERLERVIQEAKIQRLEIKKLIKLDNTLTLDKTECPRSKLI